MVRSCENGGRLVRPPTWLLVLLVVLASTLATTAGRADPPVHVPGTPSHAGVEGEEQVWSRAQLERLFPNPDAKAPAETFLGNTECSECHGDRRKSLGTSFHAALLDAAKSRSKGCESCHGPGEAHWEEAGEGPIRNPAHADAAEVVATCLACHTEVLSDPIGDHRAWVFPGADGPTPTAARSCTQCHDVHVDRSSPAFDPELGPFESPRQLAQAAEPVPARRCIECHADFHPEMRRSGHASLLTEGAQCGACHGEGSLHADSGGRRELILRPDELTASVANRVCNDCHRSTETLARWTCSEHAREGVSCTTCHDANAPRGETLRAPEYQLCGSCHVDVKASFLLPNGHDVEDGKIGCTDCHDPHGNTSRVRDRQLRRDVCADCHVAQAGPFFHDHGIRRGDGCLACHAPHGSSNRRALTHTELRPLCLQCHPETPHDLTRRKYRNCIDCHVEIHGSDVHRLFLR